MGMTDKKQVMFDIERCICHVPDACRDCSKYKGVDGLRCMEELMADAYALLKEQESVIEALKSDLDETLAVLGEQAEIVRCRDCKYWRTNTEFCMRWSVSNVAHHTPPNWFFADGERKD